MSSDEAPGRPTETASGPTPGPAGADAPGTSTRETPPGRSTPEAATGTSTPEAAPDGLTREAALTALREQRRRLNRWQWTVWPLVVLVLAGVVWAAFPPPYGGGVGAAPLVTVAFVIAATLFAWASVPRWQPTVGSACRHVTDLRPATVVASGGVRIAVRLDDEHDDEHDDGPDDGSDPASPARPDDRKHHPEPGSRWGWRIALRPAPPEPGRRVWVDAQFSLARRTPVVVATDGSAQVVWPYTTPEADHPTRFAPPGSSDRDPVGPTDPAGPGDALDPPRLADLRRKARTTVFLWGGLLVMLVGGTAAVVVLDVSMGGGLDELFTAQMAVISMQISLAAAPRAVPAWRLLRSRRLVRVQINDQRARSPYATDQMVRARLAPADRSPDAGDEPVWTWELTEGCPGWSGVREVWLEAGARPGRRVAAFVPRTRGGDTRLVFAATPVAVYTDSELTIG